MKTTGGLTNTVIDGFWHDDNVSFSKPAHETNDVTTSVSTATKTG